MAEYQEPEKIYVRRQIWKTAIDILCARRHASALVSPEDISSYLSNIKHTPEIEKIHKNWLKFFDSRVGKKTPQDLKIAYLCGPSPENDLECLIEAGVDPRNVWGVELSGAAFNSAAASMQKWRGIPLKLFHGDFSEFCANTTKERFDIVYFDACGPLPGVDLDTLEILAGIFESSILDDRSILITNFSGGDTTANDIRHHGFIGTFLRSRTFCDARLLNGLDTEYFVAGPNEPDAQQRISVNPKTFDICYGDFITRFIMRLAGRWSPLRRLVHGLSKGLMDLSVTKTARNSLCRFLKKELIKEIKLSPDELAYGSNNANIEKMMNGSMEAMSDIELNAMKINNTLLGLQETNSDYRYFRAIYEARNSNLDMAKLLKKMEMKKTDSPGYSSTDFMMFEFLMGHAIEQSNVEYLADSFINYAKSLYQTFGFSNVLGPSLNDPEIDIGFCSIQGSVRIATEWALAQLYYPNFVNTNEVRRWMYKAKATNMFLDLFPIDRARYLFDFVPSIEFLNQEWAGPSFFRFFLAMEHLLWRKLYSNLDDVLDWGFAVPDKMTDAQLKNQVDLLARENIVLTDVPNVQSAVHSSTLRTVDVNIEMQSFTSMATLQSKEATLCSMVIFEYSSDKNIPLHSNEVINEIILAMDKKKYKKQRTCWIGLHNTTDGKRLTLAITPAQENNYEAVCRILQKYFEIIDFSSLTELPDKFQPLFIVQRDQRPIRLWDEMFRVPELFSLQNTLRWSNLSRETLQSVEIVKMGKQKFKLENSFFRIVGKDVKAPPI